MRIIYFGTPDIAAEILESLLEAKIEIAAIVTKPDTPQGRSLKLTPPAVKLAARDIPVLQPEKCSTPEVIEQLKAFKADLFVVVAYGEILSDALLQAAPKGAINVHFSLLPKYRGAAPFQRALMEGEKESGVSIIRLVKKMDAGDILEIEPFPIPDTMNCGELTKALCALGTKCLLKVLADFDKGQIVAVPQDHSKATFANKITQEECRLDWAKPARVLHNLVRALSPFPGAWCEVVVKGEKKRLKVFQAELVNEASEKELTVPCSNGYLRLIQIQLEGKPRMLASDFLRGIPRQHIQFVA